MPLIHDHLFLSKQRTYPHIYGWRHSPESTSTGFGTRKVKHKHKKERVFHRLSDGLGSATISAAQIMAINVALRWCHHEYEISCSIYMFWWAVNTHTIPVHPSRELQNATACWKCLVYEGPRTKFGSGVSERKAITLRSGSLDQN